MRNINLLVAALLLVACASETRVPMQAYDFGVTGALGAPAGQDVYLSEIRTADWFNTTDMLYRLEYRDPRVLRPYSASRWAGTPAAMLGATLRQSVADATPGRRAKCNLSLFVSEFSQVFTNDHDSRAVLRLRATLTDTSATGQTLMRDFSTERPASPANAAGAAAAFSEIATSVATAINGWITQAGVCQK
jgi:cholesterol transport system auxiliary component